MAREKKTSLVVQLLGDDSKLAKSLTSSQKRMKKFGSIGKSMAKGVAGAMAGLTAVTATLGKQMVDLASDANEAQAMFEETFGNALPQASAFVEEFAHKAGFAEHELQQLLGTSGAVMQGIDFTTEASADLSMKLATLAGDVASFSNAQGGAKAVLDAMTKSLLGERESLKTYGIAINEAEVQTKAFEMTGKSSAKELTKQEKALATYQLLLKKTTVQQGDLNRTQDSFANKSRKAQAQLKEMKVTLGAELLPVAQELLPVFMDTVKSLNPSLTNAIKALSPFLSAMGRLIGALLPPIMGIVTAVLNFMQPAFQFLTDFVLNKLMPVFQKLPEIFENAINRIINKINGFINVLNGFATKIENFFKRINIDIKMPRLSGLQNVDFTSNVPPPPKPPELDLDDTFIPPDVIGDNTGDEILGTANRLADVVLGGNGNGDIITNNYNVDIKAGVGDPYGIGMEMVRFLKAVEQKNGSVPITTKSSFRTNF